MTGGYVYTKLSNRAELAWFEEARNTLSQRTFGLRQSVETRMDISRMRDGDVAGLAAYNRGFSYVAVIRVAGVNTLGLFNYATQSTGGQVDFDHYLLSDVLTAQGRLLDTGALDDAIAYAGTLSEADYPADARAAMRAALDAAVIARGGQFGTQNQIDAPERALSYQLARLGVLRLDVPRLLSVTASSRCLAKKAQLVVELTSVAPSRVTGAVTSPYGSKEYGSRRRRARCGPFRPVWRRCRPAR
ncbi:hypothetical protein [Micromonospora sp. LOL_023]|uniref:hypothetical protein n=1 Tax=Micromonospora sp. LOL_023 TaxID=3345418 RepID=UPI003A87F622